MDSGLSSLTDKEAHMALPIVNELATKSTKHLALCVESILDLDGRPPAVANPKERDLSGADHLDPELSSQRRDGTNRFTLDRFSRRGNIPRQSLGPHCERYKAAAPNRFNAVTEIVVA
jgi:hypothetical protein